jgi:hypothetical protein
MIAMTRLIPKQEFLDAMNQMVEEGFVEVVPTCQVNLPPEMAARLRGVKWTPWDGDKQSLVIYKATGKGLAAAAVDEGPNVELTGNPGSYCK